MSSCKTTHLMRTFLIWVSFCLAVIAQVTGAPRTDEPSGVKFFTGSWKALLAEAKRQNKPVFIDVYTSWCGPCKLMAKEAFPDKKVGEKFNASFISYQIDAEKGEGVAIARRYTVRAYPTSLYVSTNGTLLHRSEGYDGIESLLTEADRALTGKKETYTLAMMDKDYAAGKRDVPFLATYLTKRAMVNMPDSTALNIYLDKIPQADWSSDKNLFIIAGNVEKYSKSLMATLYPKMIQLKNATDGASVSLHSTIGRGVRAMNEDYFKQAISRKDETILNEVIKVNEAYLEAMRGQPTPPEQAEQIASGYRARYYKQTTSSNK